MSNKIIKIHGCSGAGKTTVARAILTQATRVTVVEPKDKPEAYICEFPELFIETPIIVLGSYANNCGGMDTVDSAAKAMEMVKFYHPIGHIIHEGLLQSTYYGAMGVDSKQYGDDYIYAFLDTPLMTCLSRVVLRREQNQSKNKFNPQLTTDKFNTIERLREKLPAMGHKVAVINHQEAFLPQLFRMLGVSQ